MANLTHLYRFNGNGADAVGTYTMSATSSAPAYQPGGGLNGCYLYDGASVPKRYVTDTAFAISAAFSFKFDFTMPVAPTSSNPFNFIGQSNANVNGFYIFAEYVDANTTQIRWINGSGTGTGYRFKGAKVANSQLTSGGFHQFIGTRSAVNTDGLYYLDGGQLVQNGSTTLSGTPGPIPTCSFEVAGAGTWESGNYYAGQIDEVALFGYVLPAGVISSYNAFRKGCYTN